MGANLTFDLPTLLVGVLIGAAAYAIAMRSWLLLACLAAAVPATLFVCAVSGIPTYTEGLSVPMLGLGLGLGFGACYIVHLLRMLRASPSNEA